MLVVNGIDATSGDYLLGPVSARELATAVLDHGSASQTDASLVARHHARAEPHLAPRFGVDERDLSQAGWGVVFPAGADPDVSSALKPLLDLRRVQSSSRSERHYRELSGEDGYQSGESKDDFLRRLGAGPGPVRPEVLPYYLLLVGGPEEIPFDFQYQLGVQHAVGRIAFDEPDQYAMYASNVVQAENRTSVPRHHRMSVFAPRAPEDPATRLSSELLALPLSDAVAADAGELVVTRLIGEGAHKEELLQHLSSNERPELLLTASHGLGYPLGHPGQRQGQGALVCQDWPGPGSGPVKADHCLAGSDLATSADLDLSGMIAVLFACFGAGTPCFDEFTRGGGVPTKLADVPFVSALPQAMLAREGGALAVVGHVDRAWSYSFSWPGAGAQTEVFRSLLARIGAGDPLGAAMSYLTDRYAEVATELALAIEQVRLGRRRNDEQFAGLWTAYVDARDFVVMGDPAVSLGRVVHTAVGQPVDARSARGAPSVGELPPVTPPTSDVRVTASENPSPLAAMPPGASAQAVDVATYVTRDMASVVCDPTSGRISGAELVLISHVESDGSARHVVRDPTTASPEERTSLEAVAQIHARLLDVSVHAQREGPPADPSEES